MTHDSGPGDTGFPGAGEYGGGWGSAPQWGPGAWPPPPPPTAPQPGVVPLRPLALGEILSGSFATIRRHWKQLAGVILAVQACVLPVMALVVGVAVAAVHRHIGPVFDLPPGEEPAAEDVVALVVAACVVLVLLGLIGLLGMAVLAALCPAVLKEAVMGRPTSFRALWRATLRRAPAVAGALFLTAVIAAFPVLLALAVAVPVMVSAAAADRATALLGLPPVLLLAALPPAVWLTTRFALAPAAVVMEDAGPITALRRSAALVRGDWWRVFGITVLAGLLGSAIAWLIQLPFNLVGSVTLVAALQGVPEGAGPSAGAVTALVSGLLIAVLGGAVGQMFQIGFTQLVSSLLYVDQRMRREGLAEALLAGLATDQAPTPQPQPQEPPAGR
ncbi:hypothetical protein AB0953_13360 [Streptomyces sp. NPDC046866]|uniref:hypothetical protein n=1 Tax=Streptomyces sp. NPDC046866 TaxID=3154921 RepID=UPI003453FCF8